MTAVHDRFVSDCLDMLTRDERVVAAWLEGSLAAGSADEWSDVDLHYAIDDDSFESVSSDTEMRLVLGEIAPILGANRLPFGPGLVLLNATIEGPLRVDLYAERRSFSQQHPRLGQPVVLFDRVGLSETFRVEPEAAVLPPPFQLAALLNRYAYGFMWPVRLLGRRSYTSALMNAAIIAHEFLVPALLAQERPAEMHRELLTSERFLAPESRARVEAILDGGAAGYLARADDGGTALAEAHAALVDGILSELRTACALHGVEWPTRTEREIRSYIGTALGLEL
jgi:hypothetical protein